MTFSAASSHPPIILLVEDDLDTAEMYETYLSGAGYWVASAHSGADACTTFDELRPDIVVTDLGLPQRTAGLQFIDHVRERASDTPVVVVTGAERSTVPHAIVSRVTSILVKPVLPDRLESEVRSRLQHSHMLRERGREAQSRVQPLLDRSMRLLERSREITERVDGFAAAAAPRCPDCGEGLESLAEPASSPPLDAAGYEYFAPCRRGCGHFFREAGGERIYRRP